MSEGHHFSSDVAPLQCDNAVRQGIPLCTVHILAHEGYKVGHRHDGAAYYEIVAVFFLYCIPVQTSAVVESDGFCHSCSHFDFFANGINKCKLRFGEEYSKWDAGETTSCANIKYFRPRTETNNAGNAKAMKNVVAREWSTWRS